MLAYLYIWQLKSECKAKINNNLINFITKLLILYDIRVMRLLKICHSTKNRVKIHQKQHYFPQIV